MVTERRLQQLGQLVRARRVALGRDVAPTAREIGMSHLTWAKVEAGETVRLSTYGRIEDALNWVDGSILDFLDGGPEPAIAQTDQRPSMWEVIIRGHSARSKDFAERFREMVEQLDAEEEAARRRAGRPDEGPSHAAG